MALDSISNSELINNINKYNSYINHHCSTIKKILFFLIKNHCSFSLKITLSSLHDSPAVVLVVL